MIIDNREYEWSVMIDEERAINIRWAKYNGNELKVGDVETVTPGINGTPIYLGLEDRYFGPKLALGL